MTNNFTLGGEFDYEIIKRTPEELATEYVENYRQYLINKNKLRINKLLTTYRDIYYPQMRINLPKPYFSISPPRLPHPADLTKIVYTQYSYRKDAESSLLSYTKCINPSFYNYYSATSYISGTYLPF